MNTNAINIYHTKKETILLRYFDLLRRDGEKFGIFHACKKNDTELEFDSILISIWAYEIILINNENRFQGLTDTWISPLNMEMYEAPFSLSSSPSSFMKTFGRQDGKNVEFL